MANATIDLTDAVEKMRVTFTTLGKVFLYECLCSIPYVGVGFKAPIISTIVKLGINWALDKLGSWSVMQAFFMNTALRKTSQAFDYVDAVNEKLKLVGVTNEVYKLAEKKEMDTFINLVMVTR